MTVSKPGKQGDPRVKQSRHRRAWYRGALLKAMDIAVDKALATRYGASDTEIENSLRYLTEEDIMAIQSFIRILESHTPGEIENAINHLK